MLCLRRMKKISLIKCIHFLIVLMLLIGTITVILSATLSSLQIVSADASFESAGMPCNQIMKSIDSVETATEFGKDNLANSKDADSNCCPATCPRMDICAAQCLQGQVQSVSSLELAVDYQHVHYQIAAWASPASLSVNPFLRPPKS